MRKIRPTIFEYHQIKIARSTLKMSDAGALVMGGMTKAEGQTFLARMRQEGKV